MYAYDARMASAASDAGIQVYAPMTDAPTPEDAQTDDPTAPDTVEDPSPG
jgi:hypothetical protein